MSAHVAARTYNQDHIPRKFTPGKRRVSIYWTWSYPWEAQRDPAAMENRFSTMTEVRNVLWPAYETPEWSAAQFLQGVAGTLELFHRSTLSFQKIAGETTGHPVAVFQRIDQAGYRLPIDERILADADTLMVFGLDHILSEQEAAPEEIAAIREWLKRDGTCLLLAPHHDVGFSDDMKQRQVEYLHHGDPLVPRQQRFGQYTRSLMRGLGVPVHNTYGLRPAVVKSTKEIAPLTPFHDLDKIGLLQGVPNLNFHPHLPHYEVTEGAEPVQVLARQPIDLDRPHPFTEAGNSEFNCLLWIPPNEQRAGDILLVDSTNFTTLFGGTKSLRDLLEESRGDEMKLARALSASLACALSVASPVLAASDSPAAANGTGDDPTQPLGKIELLDRYTEAPGPGVTGGTIKSVETNTPFARIEAPFRLAPQWELNFRAEFPVVWTNGVTPENPGGATVSGFGNVLSQGWIVHDFDQRWAAALGGQLIAPSSTNGVATDAWEWVTGFVVRAMLPEISAGSYFAPQARYGIDFEGNDGGRMLRQLRIAPTLNINLPNRLFFTLYPSPDIRWNYGTPVPTQTGRLFLPLDFMVGWKPTERTVMSAEFGIPIIKDFPVYTFKMQLRVGYLF